MPNPYIYSVASDMPSGAVNEGRLHTEIVDSAIATTLNSVRTDGDVLTITFTGDLSAGDKTILDGDTTGPGGGLLAAHDNTAAVSAAKVQTVEADPEITAVDAPKGSLIVWGHNHYCKEDDGLTTNVRRMGHVDQQDGTSGGTQLGMVSYSADPTPDKGDMWILEADGTIHLKFYDGTNTRVLAAEQSADILHVYASSLGAADEITAGTPENLVKGCTLADAGELGSHWTIENAGGDTMELKYAGAQTKKFLVTAVFNFTADEDGDIFSVWLYKVAAQQAASLAKAECVLGADGVTMTVHHIIELAKDDTLRLMIDSDTGTPIVTPRSLVLTATPV